jgi:hypothetical protein
MHLGLRVSVKAKRNSYLYIEHSRLGISSDGTRQFYDGGDGGAS